MSDDLHSILRDGVTRTVERLLYAEHGNDAVVQRRISARFGDMTHSQPANYTDGIAAAMRVRNYARGLIAEYAGKARGDGVPWRDLAPVLDLDLDEYDDAGICAFKAIAPRPSQPFDQVYTTWTCASCDQFITDYGPYDGDPTEEEKGHADTCARYNAEVAAVRARWENDE
jgi:hypothetical protein